MRLSQPWMNNLNLLQEVPIETLDVSTSAVSAGPSPISVSSYFGWKPLLSRIVALLLFVPTLPLLLALLVIIRLTSPGRAIFRQKRVGRHGAVFTMYKLRTMRIDAETETGPVWATDHDSRVTKVGVFIRKHHLDELPQLLNVIQGQMDIFGPRPERPEFVKVLAVKIPDYDNRHLVLPGITGLAQLNLPPDSDIHSVRRKLRLDLEYIEHGSLVLDAKMFFKTVQRLLVGK